MNTRQVDVVVEPEVLKRTKKPPLQGVPEPKFDSDAIVEPREDALAIGPLGSRSLSDLLLFELEEAPGVPIDDVVEVSNYVAALEHGMARLRGGFPLSNRLIREMHEKLLARGRGSEKQPERLD